MEALIKIQTELKAPKNQYNNFGKYKYRSCEDILEALKPLLAKYECTLTITDEIKEVAGIVYVEAQAVLTNGENARSVTAQAGINPNKKGMDISQSFGSSSSYARKYALNGLFLIDDTKDADTQKPPTNAPKTLTEKEIQVLKGKLVTITSLDDLKELWNDNPQYKLSKEASKLVNARKIEIQKA